MLLARVRVGLRALEAVEPLLELPRLLRLALQLRPAVGEALLARRQLLVHAVDGLPALLERARPLHEGVGGQHVAVWQHLLRRGSAARGPVRRVVVVQLVVPELEGRVLALEGLEPRQRVLVAAVEEQAERLVAIHVRDGGDERRCHCGFFYLFSDHPPR